MIHSSQLPPHLQHLEPHAPFAMSQPPQHPGAVRRLTFTPIAADERGEKTPQLPSAHQQQAPRIQHSQLPAQGDDHDVSTTTQEVTPNYSRAEMLRIGVPSEGAFVANPKYRDVCSGEFVVQRLGGMFEEIEKRRTGIREGRCRMRAGRIVANEESQFAAVADSLRRLADQLVDLTRRRARASAPVKLASGRRI